MMLNNTQNQEYDERIFLICDECLWNATCLNKSWLQKILGTNYLCPVCNQDQLSSFPLKRYDRLKVTDSDSNNYIHLALTGF